MLNSEENTHTKTKTMKRIICIALSLLFVGALLAQEKYTVPELSYEKKHSRVLGETYGFLTTGINFAKSQGASPYDYGLYVGTIYASFWNSEVGFEGFVKNVILSWESLRADQDDQMIVTEEMDHSVLVEFPKNAMTKYFAQEKPVATIDEVVEYFNGVLKPITAKFNSSARVENTDVYLTITLKKN